MKTSAQIILRPPVAWFGGKQWLTKIIHRYIPSHKRFVDLFSGSACILFAKPPSPIEVINDLDSGVINFYRVLRDPNKFSQLQRLITLTGYSREEFRDCKIHWEDSSDDVQRAWAWFVCARQAGNGLYGGSWSRQIADERTGIAMNVSRWLSGIESLPEIFQRLQGVQIENQDFRKILKAFDSPQTWFYADPPYAHETRGKTRYHKEMTDADHLDLVNILLDLKGMCLLSGYKTSLYEPLEVNGWSREEIPTVCFSSPISRSEDGEDVNKRPPRVECLWMSPNLQKALGYALPEIKLAA
jgi:DNA adenine methylase